MSSEEEDMKTSEKRLSLPKPDPANIKVLTSNLPKNPILPWNHFDSPWLDGEESEVDTLETTVEEEDEEPDPSNATDKKEDAPDQSVITENVQSKSSLVKQSKQDSTEEQPQKQRETENKDPNRSVNTDREDSENT